MCIMPHDRHVGFLNPLGCCMRLSYASSIFDVSRKEKRDLLSPSEAYKGETKKIYSDKHLIHFSRSVPVKLTGNYVIIP